jgi:hypothetical protein
VPSAQDEQTPFEQTIPLPHGLPSDWNDIVSWHMGAPVSQAIRPTWQTASGSEQRSPETQVPPSVALPPAPPLPTA